MCSIGEEDFGDDGGLHTMVHTVTATASNQIQIVCNKCGQPDAEFKLPFREAECQDCFFYYVRHKFRAALGSAKVLPKDAEVLFVYDGSENAACMLDMLHHAQTQNKFKRINCLTKVLHIDDYGLNRQSVNNEEYRKYLLKMRAFLERFKHFECFITPIGSIGKPPISFIKLESYLQRYREHEENFVERIFSISSLTSLHDYISHHRSKIIASSATHLKCRYVFVADISTTLASQLLSAIALGRGGNAALDVALVDERLGHGIKLLRPIKDLTEIEVRMYVKARDLETLKKKAFDYTQGTSSSLQNLTASFVQTLQENYQSTVSTVFRVGDKISSKRNAAILNDSEQSQSANCLFCNSPLDEKNLTTLLATEFSRLVSLAGTSLKTQVNFNSNFETNHNGNSLLDNGSLCHGCQNIQKDSGRDLLLPQ